MRPHVKAIRNIVGSEERAKFPWQDWNRVYPFEQPEIERYHSGKMQYPYNMSKDLRHLAQRKSGVISDLSLNRKL